MSAKPQFDIKPTRRRGPPKCAPDPAYPAGVGLQGAAPGVPSCRADLPYPAPERLVWQVRCRRCGYAVAITAAGRPDDPRSVTVPCREKLQ
jgi:hypothetical protein